MAAWPRVVEKEREKSSIQELLRRQNRQCSWVTRVQAVCSHTHSVWTPLPTTIVQCSVYECSHWGVLGFVSWLCVLGQGVHKLLALYTHTHTHTHTATTEPQSWGWHFIQVSMCFCLFYSSDLATPSPHSHSCRISESTSSSNFTGIEETESEVRT